MISGIVTLKNIADEILMNTLTNYPETRTLLPIDNNVDHTETSPAQPLLDESQTDL